jgi:hypothetical protein
MLYVVDNELAIRRHQRLFARSFRILERETIPVTLGHPGASEKAKVSWSEDLGIWFFSRKSAGSRYWNAFGVGRPEAGAGVAIVCEINFPLYGIDRRTGGAFAQDHTGRIFVVHRGKLGGGRKGVGKSLFESSYRGVWELMADGSEKTPVAVIGVLQSPRFARQIAQFVHKVALIKEAAVARSFQTELTFDELSVHEELIGDNYHEQDREIGAACDRDLIIRDLAEAMKKRSLRIGNDGRRDLVVMNRKGSVRAIFQVVTEKALPAVYAAATQLMLNGLNVPDTPLLILALPQAPENTLKEDLERLAVNVLTYEWQDERAIFPDLALFLPRIVS